MRRTWELVQGVGPTAATVLISGESGTGKEVIARALHACSPRSHRPFIAVNCGAVVASLAESELFGHEKGAFSGATERRMGVFEAANGGTLLLDEISELPLQLQAKLLRVLQEREVVREGSTQPRKLDVRIIATSNRDLREMVRNQTFREDLFYRLNVFPLLLSPLRARLTDLPILVDAILTDLGKRFGCQPTVNHGALEALARHNWPGNIRELRNVLERCLVLSQAGNLDRHAVRCALGLHPAHQTWASESADALPMEASTLADLEREVILSRLAALEGNRTRAARSLGISLRTLRNKIRDYRALGHFVPEPARRVTEL